MTVFRTVSHSLISDGAQTMSVLLRLKIHKLPKGAFHLVAEMT
jgi:hypothetical protein